MLSLSMVNIDTFIMTFVKSKKKKKTSLIFLLYKASELWKKKFTSLCLRYKQAFYKLELFIYNEEEDNRVNTFVSLK